MRKLFLLLMGVVFFACQALAQRTVTGKVTDEKGAAVPSVSVLVKGTASGTTTKADGTFSLSVPANAKTLVFSAVDMETVEKAIGTASTFSVTLKQEDKSLQEVVVVGYGSGKKQTDLVGSVDIVNAKRLQDRPSANLLDALQGQVPGLQIFNSSGEPSATPSIRLNGVGSLSAGNTPLFVMDGIPLSSGTFVSMNPEDFETITVLKDASAASIYGSRAANGVILLTSKKGRINANQINVEAQYSNSNLIKNTIDYFNGFMNTSELTKYWVETGYRTQTQIDATLAQYKADTKWGDVYYKKDIPAYQLNLNMSGGAGKTTYYVSGGYFKQEGLTYRSDFKRYTLRSNVTSAVNSWLTMALNLSGGYDVRQTNPYGSNSTNRGLAFLAPPFYSPTDSTGKNYEFIPGWGRYHPNYLADKVKSLSENLQFNPNASIQITPIKNLIIKMQAGMEAYDFNTSAVTLPSFLGSLNNGSASESITRQVTKTITNTAEYKFTPAKNHGITLLAGQEFIKDRAKSFSGSSTGQTDDRLVTVSAGPSNRNSSSSISEYSYLSYFGRINYDYKKRYFLDLSLRQDEASRFGKDNRQATFWSVGGRWNAKQEKFLENVNWLSELVLRGSIGTSGNSSIGNYDALGLVGTSQYDAQPGFGFNTAGNPELAWEKQKLTTIGVNIGLFRRVNIEVEYYNKLTSDMLLSVPFPFTSGFSDVLTNVGTLKNSGINVTINGDVIRSKDAFLTPYVNFNHNNQEVTELFQGRTFWNIPNTGVTWVVGKPVSYFYPIFNRINPDNGDPMWYLPNSDPNLIINSQQDPTKVTSVFSTAALQQNTNINRYAPFAGGFGLNGGWKGFSLQVDFSFVSGKYMINNDRFFFENPNQFPGFNQAKTVQNYWKKVGDNALFPRYGVQFTQFDTRLIEDASFMRMKNLTVGYSVPKKILSKTKFINGVRAYITGRNLLTFTGYSGPDPEVDTNVTLGANPNTKQFAFGLDFQF
ncbi:MAG: SusC/RagA family TonB-linked outer membrane protein [Bacteroidota bacterium]|nr:SusC/RagA family TonB-linked outer membrane protein [Bacteroidota bacterium]